MTNGQLITSDAEAMGSLTLDELAQQAKESMQEVENSARGAVQEALRCGMLLLTAKEKVKYGQWEEWLEEHFKQSSRHARRYMALAKRTRVSVLEDVKTIREALRCIAGPKEGSVEDRDDQIAEALRQGATQNECSKRFCRSHYEVRRIYEEQVQPDLLEVNWRAIVQKSLVKEIAIAKLIPAIEAEHRFNNLQGSVAHWAANEVGASKGKMANAISIVNRGIPALIARAESGEIAISTAGLISAKPKEEQEKELATMARKKSIDAVDDLRARVGIMLDQRLGWVQEYTDDPAVFKDLVSVAKSQDVAEIQRMLGVVADWVAVIKANLQE